MEKSPSPTEEVEDTEVDQNEPTEDVEMKEPEENGKVCNPGCLKNLFILFDMNIIWYMYFKFLDAVLTMSTGPPSQDRPHNEYCVTSL